MSRKKPSKSKAGPSPSTPAKPDPKVTPKKNDGLMGWAKSIGIAVVLWIFLRALLLEAFHITSGSMENTLLVGDVLFVNKALYGPGLPFIGARFPAIRAPKSGEIVIFDSVDTPGLKVVKRLIGMPGDTLSMTDNVLAVNGEPQDESYVVRSERAGDPADPRFRSWQASRYVGPDRAEYRPTLRNWGPFVVPPDSFFMMGDNRDESYDSRYWGFLGRDRIRGRAMIIYYSYDRNGRLPLPLFTAARWRRLFTLIR